MKRGITFILVICCVCMLLLPTFVLGASVYQEFDRTVEFRRALTSSDYDFKYDDLGINWQWTCDSKVAYADVQPMYLNFFYFWVEKGEVAVCYANLDCVQCIRWVDLNENPDTWCFQFTAGDNNDQYISGYTRLLSEE